MKDTRDGPGKIGAGPEEIRSRSMLHNAWLRQLRFHYDIFNDSYLNDRLDAPIFEIGGSLERLGSWNGRTRTITVSEHHILSHSWNDVLETLRHEMAHQYVEEILRVRSESPHGEAFAEACRMLRIDSRAAAPPGALNSLEGSAAGRDQALETIRRLLALAGSPNENEAASAMRLAHKYLLRYNLDLADLKAEKKFGYRHLGRCSRRTQEYEYWLGHILKDHFFVTVIWVPYYDAPADREGRILQICGTPENLEIASYVHQFVTAVSAGLWESFKKSGAHRGSTRTQYLAGVLRGFKEKLQSQAAQLREEHGLVWKGDAQLQEYYRHLHPRIHKVTTSGVAQNPGFEAGRIAGRQIILNKAVRDKAADRGRLLE